jgi:3-methyladenine DNA glycosylase/8-oxoguanine DNA glycosylase
VRITAKAFSFPYLVRSHGWALLSPFNWCDEREVLSRPLRLPTGVVVNCHIRAESAHHASIVHIAVPRGTGLTPSNRRCVVKQITRMLRLDDDLSDFHHMCKTDRRLAFAARTTCGGMLRCPDPFEDLVKTVCTTNCDWRNTKSMCQALCELDGGSFPDPEPIVRLSVARLARAAPLGYRAKTVRHIARLFAHGKLPLDSWAEAGEFDRIQAELLRIPGVGPYCVNHMLVLLGCYEHIPVDSEVLRYLRNAHFQGRQVSAQEAVAPYERYGADGGTWPISSLEWVEGRITWTSDPRGGSAQVNGYQFTSITAELRE